LLKSTPRLNFLICDALIPAGGRVRLNRLKGLEPNAAVLGNPS